MDASDDHKSLGPRPQTQVEVGRPLSYSQRRIWLLDRLRPGSAFHNLSFKYYFEGDLNTEALAFSLNEAASRHEVLHSIYSTNDGIPQQNVKSVSPICIPIVDLSGLFDPDGEALASFIEETKRPFDLAKGPLLRAKILKTSSDEYHLVLTLHQIVADQESLSIIGRQVAAIYRARTSGADDLLPVPSLQYSTFADWEARRLSGLRRVELVKHWQAYLAGIPICIDLPADRQRPPVQRYDGAGIVLDMPEEVLASVEEFSKRLEITPSVVLFGAFAALIQKYVGDDEVVVGTRVAGRIDPEFRSVVGCFSNALVIRPRVASCKSFRKLVAHIDTDLRTALEYQDLPFEVLIDELRPPRNAAHAPMFQVAFIYSDETTDVDAWNLPGCDVSSIMRDVGVEGLDLTLKVGRTRSGARLQFEYSTALYDEGTVRRISEQFLTYLKSALKEPDNELCSLELLGPHEKDIILKKWAFGAHVRQEPRRVHELIALQARRTPHAPAVLDAYCIMSYKELDDAATAFASLLRSIGVLRGSVVGVYLDRTVLTVVALLGVLKAGGAYLPLDPSYPADRLSFMVSDSQSKIVVSRKALVSDVARMGVTVVCVDDYDVTTSNVPVVYEEVSRSHLAYLIYTSGSTGLPKGVRISHDNLTTFLCSMDVTFGDDPPGTWLAITSISFDISVLELLWTLTRGYRVVIRSDEPGSVRSVAAGGSRQVGPTRHRSNSQSVKSGTEQSSDLNLKAFDIDTMDALERATPHQSVAARHETICRQYEVMPFAEANEAFADQVRFYDVTHLQCTPSLAGILLTDPESRKAIRSLRRMLVGGESLPTELATALAGLIDGGLHNMYGPTEATVWATTSQVQIGRLPVIGRPLPGYRVHVVDSALRPQPIGVPGELLIGGKAVSEGYHERVDLTAERFIPDHLSGDVNQRLYRTGDLVKWRSSGELEFLGRLDRQIKLRGRRIELGEIEAVLNRHDAIEQVICDVRGAADSKYIVAYVLVVPGAVLPLAVELRRFLGGVIPAHMLPAMYVQLESIPLTPNGKVNRRALPDVTKAKDMPEFRTPQSGTELVIAAAWREVLNLSAPGVDDNFFEIGGSSMLAVALQAKILERTGARVPLLDIFRYPTIAGLSAAITAGAPSKENRPSGSSPD